MWIQSCLRSSTSASMTPTPRSGGAQPIRPLSYFKNCSVSASNQQTFPGWSGSIPTFHGKHGATELPQFISRLKKGKFHSLRRLRSGSSKKRLVKQKEEQTLP